MPEVIRLSAPDEEVCVVLPLDQAGLDRLDALENQVVVNMHGQKDGADFSATDVGPLQVTEKLGARSCQGSVSPERQQWLAKCSLKVELVDANDTRFSKGQVKEVFDDDHRKAVCLSCVCHRPDPAEFAAGGLRYSLADHHTSDERELPRSAPYLNGAASSTNGEIKIETREERVRRREREFNDAKRNRRLGYTE